MAEAHKAYFVTERQVVEHDYLVYAKTAEDAAQIAIEHKDQHPDCNELGYRPSEMRPRVRRWPEEDRDAGGGK